MFDDHEIGTIFECAAEFIAANALDCRPAVETLTEEHARKIGALHGYGSKAAGRLIFAIALYAFEEKQAEILKYRDHFVALVAHKRPGEVLQ
jgi:hypothetical protein